MTFVILSTSTQKLLFITYSVYICPTTMPGYRRTENVTEESPDSKKQRTT